MPDPKIRMESLLFDYQTTNLTDYQHAPLEPPVVTKYQKNMRTCAMVRPPPLKDVHTMTEWKTELPFYLLHKKKPIIATNPREVQKPYSKPIDEEREQVQKTRPRLVMTPAVRMDDIQDPKTRAVLVDDMYTSQMTRGLKEGIPEYFNVTSPYPGADAPSHPIYLEKWKPALVAPEWRMDSIVWDSRQVRGYCDVTKEFWLDKKLNPCRSCDETAQVHNYRKLQRKMRAEQRI